jgi:hypothetical protein
LIEENLASSAQKFEQLKREVSFFFTKVDNFADRLTAFDIAIKGAPESHRFVLKRIHEIDQQILKINEVKQDLHDSNHKHLELNNWLKQL